MLVSLLLLQLCISSYAQIERTREFVNFDKGGAFVHCFFQDEKGVIWMGTSNGLSMFDGQKVCRHKVLDGSDVLKGTFIYCTLKQDDVHFYLGTEKGLYLLDLKSDTCQLLSSPTMSIKYLNCLLIRLSGWTKVASLLPTIKGCTFMMNPQILMNICLCLPKNLL